MPDEMQVTISFAAVACGAELAIAQEGLLAQPVEPDIPDGA